MKKSILFINKAQFGYHTDYYKFCEYLRDKYQIQYFCFDTGMPKLHMENVSVKYIPFKGTKIFRGFLFMWFAFISLFKYRGIIFVSYFPGCIWFKVLFPKRKMILDIRTLSIKPEHKKRRIYDRNIKRATRYYDFVTIISEGIANKIKLDKKKSEIIPLGSDMISSKNKDFIHLKLLYVGTLFGRNIIQTIDGVNLFLMKNPDITNISYDIIGNGFEFEEIKERINYLRLEDKIKLHGSIPHFKLQPYFDECNVGISYVPITDYYEHQPVTKTYEYLMSGMACLGTNTYENRKVINEKNGILCEDNPESFANSLLSLYNYMKNYNSVQIRNTVKMHTWEMIVNEKLLAVLEKLY